MINLKFNIIQSAKEIANKITAAVVKTINKRFAPSRTSVEIEVKELFRHYLMMQPEYTELSSSNSQLVFELGLVDSQNKINTIIDIIVESVDVRFIPFGFGVGKLKGGYEIGLLKPDLSEILNVPEAYQETDKGENLPWLEWLLTMGDRVIISTHRVLLGDFSYPPSRTGGAIMVKPGKWRMPAEFSGRPENNFITRAARDMQGPLQEKLVNVLYRFRT